MKPPTLERFCLASATGITLIHIYRSYAFGVLQKINGFGKNIP